MEYEDRVSISTPEGVELDIALAGIGSRLSARLIDVLLQALLVFVVAMVAVGVVAAAGGSDAMAGGLAAGLAFFAILGYDVLFEAFRGGQTPGKRRLEIRVVGDGGGPVGFRTAVVRNVMRIVDEALTLFLAALISIVRSGRNQRLGDMAASTLVVRMAEAGGRDEASISIGSLQALEEARSWDASRVDEQEVVAVRRFLERRASVEGESRRRLAATLAGRLRPKVVGSHEGLTDERFLEVVAALKAAR